MRMDRYEEKENNGDLKQSRLHKNQELYTDVYLNNVYVDINNLKEVMKDEKEKSQEEVKTYKEINKVTKYSYEEKNYDIKSIIEKAIENNKDDKLKRSLNYKNDNTLIDNLVELIQEKENLEDNHEKELFEIEINNESIDKSFDLENDKNSSKEDSLLDDLLPTDDNTEVMPPLLGPITLEVGDDNIKKEDKKELDEDFSFIEEKSTKTKFIVITLILIFLIISLLVTLFYLDII